MYYYYLNLPTQINFDSSNKIEYFYDTLRVKLEKKVIENSTITTTDYANGFIYENSALQFFNTSEGYVEPSGTDFDYIYQFKDHLDNIRLSYFDVNQNNATPVSLSIKEEHNYYPFGLKHKGYNANINGTHHKYMFGSKEYDESFQSLNTYDFGARNYDPALGRWMNIDPLAEMMRRHSPYNYAFNNPIFFIDPDGMSPLSKLMGGDSITQEDIDNSAFGGRQISGGAAYVLNSSGGSPDPVKEKSKNNSQTRFGNIDEIGEKIAPIGSIGENGIESVGIEQGKDLTSEFNKRIKAVEAIFSIIGNQFDDQNGGPVLSYPLKFIAFGYIQYDGAKTKFLNPKRFPQSIFYKGGYFNGEFFQADDFGNYAYGVAAKAMGILLDDAIKGAGIYAILSGSVTDYKNFKGYFDEKKDTNIIIRGYNGE